MKEVKYYISDDETFRADTPEEVMKYEEEADKRLKENLQKLIKDQLRVQLKL